MNFYPQMNSGAITALMTIKQQLEQDAGYLDRSDYDEDIKNDLKTLLAPKVVEVPKIEYVEKIVEKKVEVAAAAAEGAGKRGPKAKGGIQNAEVIGKEIAQTLDDLRQLKLGSKTLQPADKLAILKTQATLLERLITAEERNTNIKKMNLFMTTVMGILDDLIDDDKRQTFMKRITPFADTE